MTKKKSAPRASVFSLGLNSSSVYGEDHDFSKTNSTNTQIHHRAHPLPAAVESIRDNGQIFERSPGTSRQNNGHAPECRSESNRPLEKGTGSHDTRFRITMTMDGRESPDGRGLPAAPEKREMRYNAKPQKPRRFNALATETLQPAESGVQRSGQVEESALVGFSTSTTLHHRHDRRATATCSTTGNRVESR